MTSVRFLLGHELARARPGRPDHDGARLAAAGPSGGPAPRKAAPRATAAPAPWCSAGPRTAGSRYRAVNACIQFVAQLDGCQLLTVEDLKAADGALHPVQQAMVDCHGSQCGFCTPGFVMSLFALTREADTALPDEAAHRRRAGGQSLPLHRLRADRARPCSRPTTLSRGTTRSQACAGDTHGPAAGAAGRGDAGRRRRPAALLRAGDRRRAGRAAAGSSPRRRSSPAAPTSACG